MGRVLKIAGGLMGVVLVMMTVALWMGRSDKSNVQWLMLQGYGGNGGAFLYRTVTGRPTAYAVTPSYRNVYFVGWSADSDYAYYMGETSIGPRVSEYWLYRLEDNVPIPLAQIGCFSCVKMTPDKRGFLVIRPVNDAMALFFMEADGSEPQRLGLTLPILLPQMNVDFSLSRPEDGPFALSADGEWVIFSTGTDAEQQRVYRAKTDGSRLDELTVGKAGSYEVVFWPPDENWVIIRHEAQLYRVAVDGSEWHRLTAGEQSRREYFGGWTGRQGILIINSYEKNSDIGTVMGIRLTDGAIVWELPPGAYFQRLSADGQWVLLTWIRSDRGALEIQQIDGNNARILVEHPLALHDVWGWTPDGVWIWYTIYDDIGISLWRVKASGGEPEYLAAIDEYPELRGWSADGVWAVYTDWGFSTNEVYWLRADGSKHQQLQGLMNTIAGGWGPTLNLNWQPPILAAAGLALIASFFLSGPAKKINGRVLAELPQSKWRII